MRYAVVVVIALAVLAVAATFVLVRYLSLD